MSGCDGWGWKLEDAHDSQAHGVEGEVEHVLVCKLDIVGSGAGKRSVCVYMPGPIALLSTASRG